MNQAALEAVPERIEKVRERLRTEDCDALLLTIGPDLEYLSGYSALPLERLTMLVLPTVGDPVLVVPELEAPGFTSGEGLIEARPWTETEDPLRIIDDLLRGASSAAISDEAWAMFVLGIQERRPGLALRRASSIVAPLRRVKDPAEQEALVEVGGAADQVMEAIQTGQIPVVGRTEAVLAEKVRGALVDAGHDTVEFAIVASGPNAASPHHQPADRVVEKGEILLFDIGGRRRGYNSDTTRCVVVGRPDPEVVDAYAVLDAAHRAGIAAARVGNTCQDVDRAARSVITAAGFGDRFIHRTGHGIGLNVHEEPYIIEGNQLPLEPGFAFSVEPGIYVGGMWGMRLEDIVIVGDDQPTLCNRSSRELVSL